MPEPESPFSPVATWACGGGWGRVFVSRFAGTFTGVMAGVLLAGRAGRCAACARNTAGLRCWVSVDIGFVPWYADETVGPLEGVSSVCVFKCRYVGVGVFKCMYVGVCVSMRVCVNVGVSVCA